MKSKHQVNDSGQNVDIININLNFSYMVHRAWQYDTLDRNRMMYLT